MRAPSVRITDPGSTVVQANSTSCRVPGRLATANLTRPSRRDPTRSTATCTGTLPRTGTELTWADTPQEGLVELDDSVQAVPVGANHRPPQLVQPRPRGFVGAETQSLLKPPRGHPVLLRGDEPGRGEPGRQRGVRPVKNRPGGRRRLSTAPRTHPPSTCRAPGVAATADRTSETVRPPQLLQVVPARRLVREP